MENENPSFNRLDIPRNSPTVRASIGKKVIELTWYNSTVYRFADDYNYIDHLYINTKDEKYNVFGHPELLNILEEKKWPVLKAQEPAGVDLESYITWTNNRFDKEIGELE